MAKSTWIFFAGIVTVSVGHCHPRVNEAAKNQIDQLWHTTSIYLNSPTHEYAEKLTSKFGNDAHLSNCYFVNSGSEANDLALVMARLYTKNYDVISMRNAYHGSTSTVMGVTSLGATWKHRVPSSFGVHTATSPDPYRGPWGGAHCRDSPCQTDRKCACTPSECEACTKYLALFQEVLDYCTPKNGIAAFIVESIQGAGGVVIYPRGFLKQAFQMVRDRGGICISDEVQTGFGRTGGHFWGFEMHDVHPDMGNLHWINPYLRVNP